MFRSTDIKILSAIFSDEQRTQVIVKYQHGSDEFTENILSSQKKFQELVEVYGLDNIHEDTSNWIKDAHERNEKFMEAVAEQRGYVKKTDKEYLEMLKLFLSFEEVEDEIMFKLKIEALQLLKETEHFKEYSKTVRRCKNPREITALLLEATSPLP